MIIEKNTIYNMDCLAGMRLMESDSVDSIITDPPYSLKFMGKKWDYQLPSVEMFEEMLRVAKPGTIMLCFGGSRTFHRLACNIEDAGWRLTDTIMYMYGSGFPKSQNISKMMDKKAGKERKVVGKRKHPTLKDTSKIEEQANAAHGGNSWSREWDITEPATPEAELWDGWGTALKPAFEPIIVAMKPLDGTYVENALKYGVAGINIDGSRVGYKDDADKASATPQGKCTSKEKGAIGASPDAGRNLERTDFERPEQKGRWPANVIMDFEAGQLLNEQSGDLTSGSLTGQPRTENKIYGSASNTLGNPRYHDGDSGGASRFFYCAKASKAERNLGMGDEINNHPTVKPLKLIEYLCILTKTPTGGVVLDPFLGSGTMAVACVNTEREYICFEKEKDSYNIALKRVEYAEDNNAH